MICSSNLVDVLDCIQIIEFDTVGYLQDPSNHFRCCRGRPPQKKNRSEWSRCAGSDWSMDDLGCTSQVVIVMQLCSKNLCFVDTLLTHAFLSAYCDLYRFKMYGLLCNCFSIFHAYYSYKWMQNYPSTVTGLMAFAMIFRLVPVDMCHQ